MLKEVARLSERVKELRDEIKLRETLLKEMRQSMAALGGMSWDNSVTSRPTNSRVENQAVKICSMEDFLTELNQSERETVDQLDTILERAADWDTQAYILFCRKYIEDMTWGKATRSVGVSRAEAFLLRDKYLNA